MICSRCGTVPDDPGDDDVTPPGPTFAAWSFETGRRGIQWLCATCTRDNVRSIEAKLPEEWW